MLYNDNPELIISSLTEGTHYSSVYNKYQKIEFKEKLEQNIAKIVKEKHLYLNYKTELNNAVEEIINKVPYYLNFLASRNYLNVLFVGYYDAGKIDWLRRYNSDSYHDEVPEERKPLETFMDYNTLFQFIPIVCKEFGYNINFKVLRPVESKHNILMHDLYDFFIPNNIQTYGPQYVHGKEVTIQNFDYDAIVFLGVPSNSNQEQISENWFGFGRHSCELIDFYYGQEKRFSNSVDISPDIARTISIRSEWDYHSRVTGLSIDNRILEKTISIL